MTPRQTRGKIAVRAVIDACGKIAGAADETRRATATVGDWNNNEKPIFPPADCALAMDEYSQGRGLGTPITDWQARELNKVLIDLPQVVPNAAELHAMLAVFSGESGEALQTMLGALADGKFTAAEATPARAAVADVIRVAVAIDAALALIEGEG
ncbi:MAG: hypothetical protein J0H88_08520 [Sphingomonadales bacterium]|nr:hypothetical protein [Sphingomonadales bacterium]